MKKNKTFLLAVALITMFAASSCSVEYRTRHPRPPRTRKVIVVGKADETEKINNMPVQQNITEVDVAAY